MQKLFSVRSMLFFVLLVLLVTVISFDSRAESALPLPKLIDKIQPAVISITTFNANGEPLSKATGFFINSTGTIITNRHAMVGSDSAVIKTHDNKEFQAEKILSEDTVHDLIKIQTNISTHKINFLKITEVLPVVGEKIVVIGSPMGLDQTVSDGIISSIRNMGEDGKILQLTAPISKGSSGSPVVNMSGDVVGIATFQYKVGQNLNFAIPGSYIANMKIGQSMTIPQWSSSVEQEVASHQENSATSIVNSYSLQDGFRNIRWGSSLFDIKKANPELKIDYKRTNEEFKYYYKKKDNRSISGVEWDRVRYVFSKTDNFCGANGEIRFELKDKEKAKLIYDDLYGKVLVKYGKPFHAEKSNREGYPFVYHSIWHIGNESVSITLEQLKGNNVYSDDGISSYISMLELTMGLFSKKGAGMDLGF